MGGFLLGGLVGFGFGFLYAMARRAWASHASARELASGAGKSAWARTGELIVLGFFLAVFAALVLGGLADR
ncbi:hypothetical protein GCM10020218_060580 [Dactylosporangium vinaceum]